MERTGLGAIILAGGRGSRMGAEKGLVPLCGRPMVAWVIDAVAPLVSDLLIVANAPGYEQFGHRVVPDDIADQGPLAGLCTGLRHAQKPVNLVLSCDVRLVTTALLAHLVAHLGEAGAVAAATAQGPQPLVAAYRKDRLPALEAILATGQGSMQAALRAAGGGFYEFPGDLHDFDPQCLTNFNTPADIAAHDCSGKAR